MSAEFVLGIDIGYHRIVAGLVDRSGTLSHSTRIQTPLRLGGSAIVQAAGWLGQRVINTAANSDQRVVGVGVGAFGAIEYPTGRILPSSQPITGWAGINLAEELKAFFDTSVIVDNSVNAMALGEHCFGLGRNYASVLYVAIGEDISSAFVVENRLRRSKSLTGSEIGHLLIDWRGGRLCTCGQWGHLASYVSGPAILQNYSEISGLIDKASLTDLARAASGGNTIAQFAISEGAIILGKTLVGILPLFQPDAVVLGGRVSELGALWWKPLLATIRSSGNSTLARLPIKAAKFVGFSSFAGAGALVFDQEKHQLVCEIA